jgi:phenylalanyl-tRNA synthetase beta subunit
VGKTTNGIDVQNVIARTDQNIINKVELIDIYEDEEKLPGQRSLTFKVFIQSMERTLDDKVKNELIQKIITNAAKKGANLR